MDDIDPTAAQKINQIVAAAGEEHLAAYIKQTFPPPLVALGYYTVENAVNWLDFDKFMRWLSHAIQTTAASASINTNAFPGSPSILSHPTSSSPSTVHSPPRSNAVDTTDSPPPAPLLRHQKRKRQPEDVICITSDSESDSHIQSTSTKKRAKHNKRSKSDGRVVISKQLSCSEIRTITKIPSCWTVPHPEDGDFAYLLDISEDQREWLDKKNEPLSMIAIIKSEDQDSWGEGTGGSRTKPTNVVALGNVPCQAATHQCQGVWICSQFDQSLLDGHERYEPDDDAMRELWEADRAVNVRDTSSMSIRAAAFYTEVHRKKCKFVAADGAECPGTPVYRKLRQMNLDGKYGFIGCENFAAGQSHRFVTINRDVDEDLLIELFQNNGQFKSFVNTITATCARVLPPGQGGKGERTCPYPHIDVNGNIIKGELIRRKCNATIKIFAPIDRDDRRAIVYLSGPHNHPRPPSTKLSRTGKDAHKEAILAAGTTGLTVLKCDNAGSTSKVFGGNIPATLDPALSNPRIKRKLIYDLKTLDNPHGLGFEGEFLSRSFNLAIDITPGVCFFQRKMRETLPADKRYIHYLTSEDGIEIILTMLPFLARRIHSAKASLYDNTYARVHGVWKEWEVVIWDDKLDFRATITRIYSTRETYEVFGKMWPALWDTIHRVTGVEVKFKFIHGEGLRTVLVDGTKPQANAFGADLIARNKPHLSGVHVTDPQAILPFILRTCVFHVNRKFAAMALADELDEFIEWCKNSEHKVVRDWIKDKDSVRDWFWSSINEFLSEIPKEDWYLTPGDTKVPTRILINTRERIFHFWKQSNAYQLDLQVEEKIKLMEEQCVLINHRNSKGHRDRNDASRRSANHHKALDRSHAREEIEGIDAQVKALKEKKKALQATSGIKKTKKQGEKEKVKAPDENELAGLSEDIPDSSDEAGHGLAPITAAYTEQAAFLAAPMLSNFGFQLDPALEPSFPPGAGYENLDGNLEDYTYPF
ncbi:hypothetical protein DFH09DRAFT_1374151 [Mycena vulgaris]|nr:hypothetical protein DFH09DRAFT_1374151 [Mycena vulgaris]